MSTSYIYIIMKKILIHYLIAFSLLIITIRLPCEEHLRHHYQSKIHLIILSFLGHAIYLV